MILSSRSRDGLSLDKHLRNIRGKWRNMNFSKGRALIVGIANYKTVSRLPSAVLNDANDVASLLANPTFCGYDGSQVTVLLDSEATLAHLRHNLNSLVANTDSSDSVTIFFSGHGALVGGSSGDPVSALVPVDFDPKSPETSGLLEDEFSDFLKRIKSQKLVVLLDACHAGGAAIFKLHSQDSPILTYNEKSLGRLAQGRGRVLIASSRASETSLVHPGARNSVFTTHLLEGLRGEMQGRNDGLIHIFDLFNHVAEKVKLTAGGHQHPIFKASDLEDNFPLALDRAGIKDPGTQPPVFGVSLEAAAARLYPLGPTDQEIWARAGGDVSRLQLVNATGRAAWFSAIRLLRLGGGGKITINALLRTMLDDYPQHPELVELVRLNPEIR
jgi:hypothetical protein